MDTLLINLTMVMIIFGIPSIFLILCIENIIKARKQTYSRVKTWFYLKAALWLIVFIGIIYFYCLLYYNMTTSVSSM